MADPNAPDRKPIEQVDQAIERASVDQGRDPDAPHDTDLEPGGTQSEDDLGDFA